MLRARPLVIMFMSLIAGILTAWWALPYKIIPLALMVFCCAAGLGIRIQPDWNRRMNSRLVLLICVLFLVGLARGRVFLDHRQRVEAILSEGQEITVRGRVYALEKRKKGLRVLLGETRICEREEDKKGDRLWSVYLDFPARSEGESDINPDPGDEIRVRGSYSFAPPASNEGNFDQRAYEYARGIYGHLWRAERPVWLTRGSSHPYWKLVQGLDRLRLELETVFRRELPAEEGGLLSAMVLGARSGLDEELRDLFSRSGISHLLAISGLHVFLLGTVLLRLLRIARLPLPFASVLSALIIIAYGRMTGSAVSTRRAVLMYLLLILGHCLGEAYDSLSALALAGLVILAQNPMALGDLSFQFSFTAILGLLLVARPLQEAYRSSCARRFEERRHRLYRLRPRQLPWNRVNQGESGQYQANLADRILSRIILALGIQLVLLPLTAFYYSEIASYVILLNLLLIPLLGLVLGSGLLGGLLGLVPGLAIPSLFSGLCLRLCHGLLYFYEWSSDLSLRLPLARIISGKPPVWLILFYYGLLLYLVYRICRRGQTRARAGCSFRRAPRQRIREKILGCALASLLILLPILWSAGLSDRAGAEFTMLDIGQGDGLYFCDGRGGHYMIDGGSTSIDRVGKQRILPFLKARGIRKIHYWFVSHTDLDHISGLEEALSDRYPIQYLVFSVNMPRANDGRNAAYERLVKLARENRCQILLLDRGDCLRPGCKAGESGCLSVRCLGPAEDRSARGANENSLILSIAMPGLRVFSAGDIGTEQEQALLRRENTICDQNEEGFRLYKASHHGSNGANGKEILKDFQPDLIWISAGAGNHYGHPGKEALKRMKERGCPIDRTMDRGQMTLRREEGRWKYRVRFP